MPKNKTDQLIAATLTNAFYLNALLHEQKGVEVDLDNKDLVMTMTREINAVYTAFQEVVRGLEKKDKKYT